MLGIVLPGGAPRPLPSPLIRIETPWLGGFHRPPEMTYIVHGEAAAAAALREAITTQLGWKAIVAEDGQRVTL